MLLLHISDIHFRAPDCVNPDLDPDRPYRTRMVQDARNRVERLGPLEAILVSGDIAFKGDAQEYAAAFAWFKDFAGACGCPLERVFVVPGNHDVDRSVVTGSPAVRNVQRAIRQAAPRQRERELRTQFSDPETGHALLAPLAAYNNFAKAFNCQIYPPERLYWKQDLPLQRGVQLRVYGLTSTLLSGAHGQDDTRDSLYLSPLQTVLDPVDDVVNLVMCHHPPDWFMDHDDVEDHIRGRSAIHLFGHKHRRRIFMDEQYVQFGAGAVNPDRHEPGWQPGYNLIDLRIEGEGRDRALEIDAHLLEWQSNPDLYRPVQNPDRGDVFRHRLPIPSRASAATGRTADASATKEPAAAAQTIDVEAAMGDENTRNLVLRFWNLRSSQRRDIAMRLGLIEASEMSLPEPERYGRALVRARERGLLERVAHEVSRSETG